MVDILITLQEICYFYVAKCQSQVMGIISIVVFDVSRGLIFHQQFNDVQISIWSCIVQGCTEIIKKKFTASSKIHIYIANAPNSEYTAIRLPAILSLDLSRNVSNKNPYYPSLSWALMVIALLCFSNSFTTSRYPPNAAQWMGNLEK